MVPKGGVNDAIGLVESPGNIRHKMLSDFPDPPLTHFTQPLLLACLMAVPQLGKNAASTTACCAFALRMPACCQ
jgi:hypothetical protein